MQWTGEHTHWDRNSNVVELRGNATVNQPGETLTADYIRLDLEGKKLFAQGNAVYVAKDTILRGQEIDFDLVTRTGIVRKGRLTNGLFLLQAEELEKVGPFSYQSNAAEYTTCSDCPGSWSFYGEDVQFEVEGYARMKNVTSRIKEAPVFWLPYLVIPVKKKRQSGVLFPKLATAEKNGVMFVLPFFWAINRSADMTLGLGTYTRRGKRVEWEGRYALTDRSGAIANVWYTADSRADSPRKHRYGIHVSEVQELPFRFEQRFHFLEASDNRYPIEFPDDLPGRFDPVLTSSLSLSTSQPWYSAILEGRRNRNLLNFQEQNRFDPATVQPMPSVLLTTNDQLVPFFPIVGGVSVGFTNFSRADGQFDKDFFSADSAIPRPGIDPIRKANRLSLVPVLYTTLNPWGLFSIVPSVQYQAYSYSFGQSLPNLTHSYLHTKLDFSMNWSRIYEKDDPESPRMKHVIRPTLSYSRIPYARRPNHPFLQQIEYKSGYRFDNYDIIPLGASPSLVNYFTPQGNSLSYGILTQLVLKRQEIPTIPEKGEAPRRIFGKPLLPEDDPNVVDSSETVPTYQRMMEFSAGQTIDFYELRKPEDERIPFSRLYSTYQLALNKFSWNTQYYFYPHLGRYSSVQSVPAGDRSPHDISTSFRYTQYQYTKDVFTFERSVELGYAFNKIENQTSNLTGGIVFAINDYLTPSAKTSYDFLKKEFRSVEGTIVFRPPSRCWQFMVSPSIARDTGAHIRFDLSLNLTGSGYSGLSGIDSTKSN